MPPTQGTPPTMRSIAHFSAISMLALPLGFCQHTQAAPPSQACSEFSAIYWSKNDTRTTKEQVDRHNRIGKALCGWGKK